MNIFIQTVDRDVSSTFYCY